MDTANHNQDLTNKELLHPTAAVAHGQGSAIQGQTGVKELLIRTAVTARGPGLGTAFFSVRYVPFFSIL